MIRRISLWYLHTFQIVITRKEAVRLGLKWCKNVYGDGITFHNCRSYWKDENAVWYKVEELEE